jgi:hypothetical protein
MLDITTGLIQEDRLNFNWNFIGEKNITRYQKLISAFAEKFEVMQKVGVSLYEKAEIQNPNTEIVVSVQNPTEPIEHIYLTYRDPDNDTFKSFQLEKGENGKYNFQFRITYPHFNLDKRLWI